MLAGSVGVGAAMAGKAGARSISHRKEKRDGNSQRDTYVAPQLGGFWSSSYANQPHQPETWDRDTLSSQVTNPGARDAPQDWQQEVIDKDRELKKKAGKWTMGDEVGYQARRLAPYVVSSMVSSHMAGALPATNAAEALAGALGKRGANYGLNQFISGEARKGRIDDLRMEAMGMSPQEIRSYNAQRTRDIMGEDLMGGGNGEEFFQAGQAVGNALGLKTIDKMPEVPQTAAVETPPPVIDPTAQGPAPHTQNNLINLSRQRRLMGNPFAAQAQRLSGVLGARG